MKRLVSHITIDLAAVKQRLIPPSFGGLAKWLVATSENTEFTEKKIGCRKYRLHPSGEPENQLEPASSLCPLCSLWLELRFLELLSGAFHAPWCAWRTLRFTFGRETELNHNDNRARSRVLLAPLTGSPNQTNDLPSAPGAWRQHDRGFALEASPRNESLSLQPL